MNGHMETLRRWIIAAAIVTACLAVCFAAIAYHKQALAEAREYESRTKAREAKEALKQKEKAAQEARWKAEFPHWTPE